jgi:GT2 family glycosyltransferase/2-polyprenyl-3-methyl-5-hydroxy-6-metoxy-1,4-benzoquinol methylase
MSVATSAGSTESTALRADDVTVAIATRDRWEVLERTLRALGAQTISGFETIVVCDGTDQQAPAAVSQLPDVRVLVQEPAGPGVARNLAARASERPLLLFLGDDMIPTPELVARHLARHDRDPTPEVAVLGLVHRHPEVPDTRLERWLMWSGAREGGENACLRRFSASNLSLKRRFFLEAGGFDPDVLFQGADLDLGWRLHESGVCLLHEPRALALHLCRHDWASIERRYESQGRADRLMLSKHDRLSPVWQRRIDAHATAPPVSGAWPYLVDLVPARARAVRTLSEAKADRWYHQRLAPRFRAGWEGERDLEELREYLGEAYDQAKLVHHGRMIDEEAAAAADEGGFYRSSELYLYDLTVFAMSGTKDPYRRVLCSLVAPGARLLDYGCGIGSDGMRLLEQGYRISFADYENPSTRYLRWRLARRKLSAEIHDLDAGVPDGFDAAYAFDVIEHVDDPFAFLAELERRAEIIVVNLLDAVPGETALHRPLPVDAILAHATDLGLLRYRRHHGRSHLLAYRSARSGGRAARLRSLAELRRGSMRGA